MTTSVTGVFDVTAPSWGAVPDGSTDATAAINKAITACIEGGGGIVYLPGQFLISSPLLVDIATVHVPVTIAGISMAGGNNVNTPGGSALLLTQTSGYGIKATGGGAGAGGMLAVKNLTMSCLNEVTDTDAEFDAICAENVVWVDVERFQLLQYHDKTGAELVVTTANSGVHVIGAYQAFVSKCMIHAEVSAVWMDRCDGLTVEDCYLGTTNGTGYGSIRMDDTAAGTAELSGSLNISNVVTGRGDWGLWVGGTNAGFIYADNFQVNRPNVGGLYFGGTNSSQVWLEYAWVSMAEDSSAPTIGIKLDAGFTGWFSMFNSVVQAPSTWGLYVANVQGVTLVGNSFGGCGHGKANAYDDILIGANSSAVTLTGNHFDVDKFNTLGGARSALNVQPGAKAVSATGNLFASGYKTAPVIDNGHAVVQAGNVGYAVAPAAAAPSATAEGELVQSLAAPLAWLQRPPGAFWLMLAVFLMLYSLILVLAVR